jgi:hypothetical protein
MWQSFWKVFQMQKPTHQSQFATMNDSIPDIHHSFYTYDVMEKTGEAVKSHMFLIHDREEDFYKFFRCMFTGVDVLDASLIEEHVENCEGCTKHFDKDPEGYADLIDQAKCYEKSDDEAPPLGYIMKGEPSAARIAEAIDDLMKEHMDSDKSFELLFAMRQLLSVHDRRMRRETKILPSLRFLREMEKMNIKLDVAQKRGLVEDHSCHTLLMIMNIIAHDI